jgi:hypothetical protein
MRVALLRCSPIRPLLRPLTLERRLVRPFSTEEQLPKKKSFAPLRPLMAVASAGALVLGKTKWVFAALKLAKCKNGRKKKKLFP